MALQNRFSKKIGLELEFHLLDGLGQYCSDALVAQHYVTVLDRCLRKQGIGGVVHKMYLSMSNLNSLALRLPWGLWGI